jgi:hypothetical protein
MPVAWVSTAAGMIIEAVVAGLPQQRDRLIALLGVQEAKSTSR